MLAPNMVLKDALDTRQRLLWIHAHEGVAWLFALSDPKALPVFCRVRELEIQLVEGQMRIETEDASFARIHRVLTTAEQRVRDQALKVIETLVRHEPDIYDPEKRGRLVRAACAEFNVSRPVIYKWLRRWWSGGCVANALVPDYACCGAPDKERIDNGGYKPVGRKRIRSPGTTLNLTATHRQNIELAVRSRYLKSDAGSLGSAYRWMLNSCYRDCIDIAKRGAHFKIDILAPGKVPSFGQFSYHAQRLLNARDKLVRKHRQCVELKFRMLPSDSNAQVKGPGARYQIDATVVDLYLVSKRNRNRILGRPTLYLVVDVFSGAIVGFYLGLEAPCWIGALMALLSTLEDKEALCARLGVPISEGSWPMRGFPRVLLGDGGEVAMRSAERLAQDFGVEVETAPPYRGDAKGLVERSFRTLQAPLGEYAPGYVSKADYVKRSGKDYRLDAVLTLQELTQIFLTLIIEHNLKPRRAHPEEVDVVRSGEALSPLAIWNWGVKSLKNETRNFPLQDAEACLLPRKTASVSRRGINPFRGLYYLSDELLASDWFERAVRDSTRVEVAYDPRCMDRAYVFPPAGMKSAKPVIAQLTRHSRRFGDDPLADVMGVGHDVAANNAAAALEVTETQIAGDLTRNQIIAGAKAEAKRQHDSSLSKRERTKDIRNARADEKMSMRPDTPLYSASLEEPPGPPAPPAQPSHATPAGAPPGAEQSYLDEVSSLFGDDR